jgi:Cu/Ag efflux protein CusF
MKKLCLLTTASLLSIGVLASTSLLGQTQQSNVTDDGSMTLAQSDHGNMPMPKGDDKTVSGEPVRSRGTVQKVEEESRKVTLAHEAIPEWQWPSMTMSFDVAEDVDLSGLREGAKVEFDAVRPEGGGQRITGLRMLED